MDKDFVAMQIEMFDSLLDSAEAFISKASNDKDEVIRIAATFEAAVSLVGFITANHVREEYHKETIDDVKESLETLVTRYRMFKDTGKEGVTWH